MKKIIVVIILLLLIGGGIFGWMFAANNIANDIYQKINNYQFDIDHLESEKLFDFSSEKYFDQKLVSEGTTELSVVSL